MSKRFFMVQCVRKYAAYVHRYVFWSNFVYFVCLISVCPFISVCFHRLPETVNKDEYILISKFNENLRLININYVSYIRV